MLREKDLEKERKELAKEQRKEDRELKKVQKAAQDVMKRQDRVRKQEERENKKMELEREKERKRKEREEKKANTRRTQIPGNDMNDTDSSSDSDGEEMQLASDDDFEEDPYELCWKCQLGFMDVGDCYGYDNCPRYYHLQCAANILSSDDLTSDDLLEMDFSCGQCDQ